MHTLTTVLKIWESDLINDASDNLEENLSGELNKLLGSIVYNDYVIKTVTHTAVVKDNDIIHYYTVFYDHKG